MPRPENSNSGDENFSSSNTPASNFPKLARCVYFLESITEHTGKLIAWLTLFVVLATFAIVVMRYGFNLGSIAWQESVLYAHGFMLLMGAGYTLKHDGHVRVDIFYHKFSVRKKAWVNLLGTLVLALPVACFIFYISFDYVMLAWSISEASAEPGGLPFVYLQKGFLLVFVVSFSIQLVAEVLKQLITLLSPVKNSEAS